jgi:hypothetical protein
MIKIYAITAYQILKFRKIILKQLLVIREEGLDLHQCRVRTNTH